MGAGLVGLLDRKQFVRNLHWTGNSNDRRGAECGWTIPGAVPGGRHARMAIPIDNILLDHGRDRHGTLGRN